MDIAALASSIATMLIPLLPYLLELNNKAAEETRRPIPAETQDRVKELWGELRFRFEGKPSALEALQDVTLLPNDLDAQAAFRQQLKKLLKEDKHFAQTMTRLLEEMHARGPGTSGDRSVAIGGSVIGSAIISGDGNIINEYAKEKPKPEQNKFE